MNTITDVIVKSKYFQHCPVKKLKRYRSAFTTEQINYLEKEFKTFPYIGSANRKEIANVLKISERAIKIWFQNRRMKEKRETGNKVDTKNKEATVGDRNNVKFPNDQLNRINNGHQCIPVSNLIASNNQLLTSRNKYLMKPKVESTAPFISNMRSMNLANKSNKQIPPKNCNNLSKLKPTLSHKIRNNKNDSQQQHFIANSSYFNQLNRPEKLRANTMNEAIPSQKLNNNERAQDLSISRNNKLQRQFCQEKANTNQGNVPIYPQNYLASSVPGTSAMPPGNVLWKPVSLMPVMPGLAPVTLNHGNMRFSSNHEITNASCNCHGPLHNINAPAYCTSSLQPHYILAIPVGNPIQKI